MRGTFCEGVGCGFVKREGWATGGRVWREGVWAMRVGNAEMDFFKWGRDFSPLKK
jgi:hypothetical protein